MNRKGFTLVELLAVILILSSISLVAVISITSSLARRDVKECEEQRELAINAAKIYFSLNDGTSVTIATLKSENYFSETKKTDRLDDDMEVQFNNENATYSLYPALECDGS